MPSLPNAFSQNFFVYGTLRRGESRDINLLRPAPLWQGQGHVIGALYDLGSYPGLVLERGGGSCRPQGKVIGEVYAVSQKLERLLDEIEEVWPQQTGEYSKRLIEVQMDASTEEAQPGADAKTGVSPSRKIRCLVYELHPSRAAGKPVIGCGDWVAHRRELGGKGLPL